LAIGDGPGQKHHKAGDVSKNLALAANPADPLRGFASGLSWSHYRILTKVKQRAERLFYEIEAEKQNWSVPQLERQIDSLLFARLLKSRNKAGLIELATRGQVVEKPTDALKDPYVLDFLDLPDGETLHESQLEAAILHKLQAFLLELGKGFAFVSRQKRLAFEDEHFYVDLVFYNIILKCYLLIDLKVGKLSHQDIGQMDGYVRLFDDQCTTEDDNPTIGLILCARKNEAIARYSVLSESKQIFAARYLQVLPTEEELRRELERERRLLEMQRGPKGEPEEE
jgi:predicted nuclease of restriction endonuclease-like (RecB) superfamily